MANRKKGHKAHGHTPEDVAAAVNEARSVEKASLALGLSRQGVYAILERAGLQLVRERCAECGTLRRGKVVAQVVVGKA